MMPWKSILVVVGFCCTTLLCQNAGRPSSQPEEALALKYLSAINRAATVYYSWLNRVPTTLKQLGPTDRQIADGDAADLIPIDLARGIAGGYQFTLRATSKNGWVVTAAPVEYSGMQIQTIYRIESRIMYPAPERSK
jgi:hypothetical protein